MVWFVTFYTFVCYSSESRHFFLSTGSARLNRISTQKIMEKQKRPLLIGKQSEMETRSLKRNLRSLGFPFFFFF